MSCSASIDLRGLVRKGVSFACVNLLPASTRHACSSCIAADIILLVFLVLGCGAVKKINPDCQFSGSITLIL